MSTVTKYLIYGPKEDLKRLPEKLASTLPPKFLYKYESTTGVDRIFVTVYEEYDKTTNSTVSVTCVTEYTPEHTRIHLKKSGGRLGFKGSSLREEKNIESDIIEFIIDYTTRYGLSMQNDEEGDDDTEE
jgi:hypothetical protein